ncbi:UBX domain-containing protein 1 [Haematobia irritans]|uniref:UBX domain-containing protein 1 n=1 Tax=Haematobia irritans TaxID=7368 RepID=UPI003F50C9DB
MGDVQVLMDMGFPQDRVEYALKVTNNKGVEPAMEWLLAHVDESIPQPSSDAAPNEPSTSSQKTEVVKSFKCDDCGKILCKDQGEVEFHAAKTGHSNFSESTEEKKPLTEEEKKQQLALIEEKLKLKRLEREEREKQDALERERNRIKSGKDMSEARRKNEELEMKKIIEQRKREKADEKAARERVRAQIEADKARRKAASQTPSSPETPVASSSVSSTTTPVEAVKSPPKDYKETRIQIRLQDGSTLTETFNVQEQLSAVRVFIQMKTGNETPFGLMTSFPRKVFNSEDFEKPLSVLGLVPSAVLIMTKVNV